MAERSGEAVAAVAAIREVADAGETRATMPIPRASLDTVRIGGVDDIPLLIGEMQRRLAVSA